MSSIIEVEHGVFSRMSDPELSEGQTVRIILDNTEENEDDIDDILELAAQVYEGLSVQDINEIEQIAFNRTDFFKGNICDFAPTGKNNQ